MMAQLPSCDSLYGTHGHMTAGSNIDELVIPMYITSAEEEREMLLKVLKKNE